MQIPLYSIKNLDIKNKHNEQRLQIKQFDVHRGACYVFEGCMGSGKTTFLDILYSRQKIGQGEIKFEEKNNLFPDGNLDVLTLDALLD